MIPTTIGIILRYIVFLSQHLKPSIIHNYLGVVTCWHRALDLPSPIVNSLWIQRVLQRLRRLSLNTRSKPGPLPRLSLNQSSARSISINPITHDSGPSARSHSLVSCTKAAYSSNPKTPSHLYTYTDEMPISPQTPL